MPKRLLNIQLSLVRDQLTKVCYRICSATKHPFRVMVKQNASIVQVKQWSPWRKSKELTTIEYKTVIISSTWNSFHQSLNCSNEVNIQSARPWLVGIYTLKCSVNVKTEFVDLMEIITKKQGNCSFKRSKLKTGNRPSALLIDSDISS